AYPRGCPLEPGRPRRNQQFEGDGGCGSVVGYAGPIPGCAECQRFRDCIQSSNWGTNPRSHYPADCPHQCSANTNRGTCDKESVANNVWGRSTRGIRRPHVICAELC